MHEYLLCVIIGAVLGMIVGWAARGDENRRYHTRRSMADTTLTPLPTARVVAWVPRGSQALTANSPNDWRPPTNGRVQALP